MNKETRHSMIAKYLEAETTVHEELVLARWYALHEPLREEEPVAKMLLAEYPEVLYDAMAREFEAIVPSTSRRRSMMWRFCAVAACVAVVFGLASGMMRPQAPEFGGQEVAECIGQIMLMGNVESVTARREGDRIILTAVNTDGSNALYVMSKDDTSTISITAMNE